MLSLLLVLLPVVALLDGWIHRPGWPDLTLAFLIPLLLRGENPWILPVAFVAAVFREGLDPFRPWLFPLFVVVAFALSTTLRVRINLKLLPIRLAVAALLVLLDLLLLAGTHTYSLADSHLWLTGLWTLGLSALFLVKTP